MTDMTTGRVRTSTVGSDTAMVSGIEPMHRLSLGNGDVNVAPTDHHVAGSSVGSNIGQVRQQPPVDMTSLRNRTVPRWRSRGAVSGVVATTLAVGATSAILAGIGKGAAIGAAAGALGFGAGAIVGAVVGGIVGGIAAAVAGGLIGRWAAGGSGRDKAEQAILGLMNQGKISPQEASQLKGLSDSELKDLVSISKRKTGITSKADRNAVRQAVLLTAAKQGLNAAKLVKAELLNMRRPGPDEALEESTSAIGAKNRIALQPHLESSLDSRFTAVQSNPTRLDEYQRFMADAVGAKSRAGQTVDDQQMRAFSRQALDHVGQFQTDHDLETFRAKRQDFDDGIRDLMQDVADDAPPAQLLARLAAADRAYGEMAVAEGLGVGDEQGASERTPRFDAAFARAAARAKAQGRDLGRTAQRKALANGSPLRATFLAAKDVERMGESEQETKLGAKLGRSVEAIVGFLGMVQGPVGDSVGADQRGLDDQSAVGATKVQQAGQAIDILVRRDQIENATVLDAVSRQGNPWMADKFAQWANGNGVSAAGLNVISRIEELNWTSRSSYWRELAKFGQDMNDDKITNVDNEDQIKINQILKAHNNRDQNYIPQPDPVKHAAEQLLNKIQDSNIRSYSGNVFNRFKTWLKQPQNQV